MSNKTSTKAAALFFCRKTGTVGNTKVINHGEVTELRLHGNLIAEHVNESGQVYISNAGWATPTTKARLNAVLEYLGQTGIYQAQNIWYWRGHDEFPLDEFVRITL
jgi:hypothetical protein